MSLWSIYVGFIQEWSLTICVPQIIPFSHCITQAQSHNHYHTVCGFFGSVVFQTETASHQAHHTFFSWQISSSLRSTQPRQSEAIVICQEEGLSSGGGGFKVAPQNIRCRPCPWSRHGQQREWADVLRWCAGQLRAPSELCRSLQDGRGQLQVQRLYWG